MIHALEYVEAGVETPGNGSIYHYIVWLMDDQWYAAFPLFGRANAIGYGNHWTYISEKFHVSKPDAQQMAKIINTCQDNYLINQGATS
jgi:hypothetical protein